MKTLTCKCGKPIQVDDVDLVKVTGYSWYCTGRSNVSVSMVGGPVPITRLLVQDVPEGSVVDHRDLDIHNNVQSNLRVATKSENRCNANAYKNNRLGIKNITLTQQGKYCVRVKKDGKSHTIGRFLTLDEAVKEGHEFPLDL